MDVVIFGSCVSRDTFDLAPVPDTRVIKYIARQSWCSLGSAVEDPSTSSYRARSSFLQRVFEDDLKGNALDSIAETLTTHPRAALLLDLTDERGGFYEGPAGEIISHNYDAARAGVYDSLPHGWVRRGFGSDAYGARFFAALAPLEGRLRDLGIWSRTAVIGNRWAKSDDRGREVPPSMMETPRMNALYEQLYDFLEDRDWRVLRPEINEPLAAANHRWGPSPFHYNDAYYQAISREVSDFLSSL